MNVIMLMLEIVVIFLTLILFIEEKEGNDHIWALNGALIGTILIIFALNFATICRGLHWCFTCGSGSAEDNAQELEAKKAIYRYRWYKAGHEEDPPEEGLFSFGDPYSGINLKKFEDPEERELFFNLKKPGEIKQAADNAAKGILRDQIKARQEQVKENVRKYTQQKEKPKATEQLGEALLRAAKEKKDPDDMYKVKPKSNDAN